LLFTETTGKEHFRKYGAHSKHAVNAHSVNHHVKTKYTACPATIMDEQAQNITVGSNRNGKRKKFHTYTSKMDSKQTKQHGLHLFNAKV
jgi:hypothetical protein